jgi:hypothetical protein
LRKAIRNPAGVNAKSQKTNPKVWLGFVFCILEVIPMADPSDQLPEESDAAYVAFLHYLSEGLGRRMIDAYNQHRLAEGKHPLPAGRYAPGTWYTWRVKHRWVQRCAAYDRKRIEEHSEVCTQEVIQMISLLAQEGICAIKEKRPLFAPWREHVELLHALAALVSENDEPKPVQAARTYNGAAPPLPDRLDGLNHSCHR